MDLKALLSSKDTRIKLMLCAGSFLFLLLAWIFGAGRILPKILAAVSFLVAGASLLEEILATITEKDFRSGLLLLLVGCILSLISGRFASAAGALLLYRLGLMFLDWWQLRVARLLEIRRETSSFASELPGISREPKLISGAELILRDYFTYLAVLLAAVVAVLTALLGKAGIQAALARAAVVLALGGIAPLFAAFPYTDAAALLRAGELGVLFRGDSLTRLLGLKLALTDVPEPDISREIAVYPAMPETVSGEMMLRLAAAACEGSSLPIAAPLSERIRNRVPAADIQRQELSGFGVAAKVKGVTVLAGSGEFMVKSGLKLLPFRESAHVLHLGIGGRYAGCIDLSDAALNGTPEELLDAAGFFRFSDEAEAREKRLPGEKLLFIAPAGGSLPAGEKEDVTAVSGAAAREGDVVLEHCGPAGVAALLAHRSNALLGRKAVLLVSGIIKALVFLLAAFGACPLWVAVLAEIVAIAFTERYSVHHLDFDPNI